MIKRNTVGVLVIGLSYVWYSFLWLFSSYIPELVEDIDEKHVSPMIKKAKEWSNSEAKV